LWVAILRQEFAKVIKGRFKQESEGVNSATVISKCTNEIYFVLAWIKGIPFSIKASKRLFPADGCGKSVVWAATLLPQKQKQAKQPCPYGSEERYYHIITLLRCTK